MCRLGAQHACGARVCGCLRGGGRPDRSVAARPGDRARRGVRRGARQRCAPHGRLPPRERALGAARRRRTHAHRLPFHAAHCARRVGGRPAAGRVLAVGGRLIPGMRLRAAEAGEHGGDASARRGLPLVIATTLGSSDPHSSSCAADSRRISVCNCVSCPSLRDGRTLPGLSEGHAEPVIDRLVLLCPT
eukprot:506258-Prymnesium_polylepis.4